MAHQRTTNALPHMAAGGPSLNTSAAPRRTHPARLHMPPHKKVSRTRAGSLRDGSLELQRICWTPRGARTGAASQEAILIGGPGSNLTEERVTSQNSFSLPGRGHVVLPLVSNGFLVGLIVLEGFNASKTPSDGFTTPATPAAPATPAPVPGSPRPATVALDRAAAPPLPAVLPSPARRQARRGPVASTPAADARQHAPADHFVRLASQPARLAASRCRSTTPSASVHSHAADARRLATTRPAVQRVHSAVSLHHVQDGRIPPVPHHRRHLERWVCMPRQTVMYPHQPHTTWAQRYIITSAMFGSGHSLSSGSCDA